MDETRTKLTKVLKFSADAILVYSPEKELEVLSDLAMKGNQADWKPAIILASAYLEKYGIGKLKEHFKGKKIQLARRLDSLSLSDVNVFLYGLDLIEEKYFTWIEQIWDARRNIVHQKGELPAYIGKEANKKYRPMIDNALEILKFLTK